MNLNIEDVLDIDNDIIKCVCVERGRSRRMITLTYDIVRGEGSPKLGKC